MNKKNLVTLSALALITACGLVSCGNRNAPQNKVDVYFRAQAATIKNESIKQEVDFKDDECATMEVEGGVENLQYGKQDVVVTIKPKKYFTFRDFDVDSWEPTGGAPVHPYVGLGNPHTLYSYPLQENVAWTFKDLSTPIQGSNFLDEKYQITIKKDFFQKNIVIDYGHMKDLHNNVLVYNSKAYEDIFTDVSGTLDAGTCNYWDLDTKYSNFVVGSGGLTITYKLRGEENPLISFKGWDKEPGIEEGADFAEYPNFKVTASNSKTNVTKELAIFEKGKTRSEQSFIPTVYNNKLSFFIKWDILANKDTYEPLYDAFNIKFISNDASNDKPFNLAVNVNVDKVNSTGVTFFDDGCAPDYFQYEPNKYAKNLSSDNICFSEKDGSGGEQWCEFNCSSVLSTAKGGPKLIDPSYGVLFKVPNATINQNPYFTISFVDGEETFINIEYFYEDMPTTEWREKFYKETASGLERDLKYLADSSSADMSRWYLVELNPKGRIANVPEQYQRKEEPKPENNDTEPDSVFYLYTNGLIPFYKDSEKKELRTNCTIKINFPTPSTL